jgi:hypothetical protein
MRIETFSVHLLKNKSKLCFYQKAVDITVYPIKCNAPYLFFVISEELVMSIIIFYGNNQELNVTNLINNLTINSLFWVFLKKEIADTNSNC